MNILKTNNNNTFLYIHYLTLTLFWDYQSYWALELSLILLVYVYRLERIHSKILKKKEIKYKMREWERYEGRGKTKTWVFHQQHNWQQVNHQEMWPYEGHELYDLEKKITFKRAKQKKITRKKIKLDIKERKIQWKEKGRRVWWRSIKNLLTLSYVSFQDTSRDREGSQHIHGLIVAPSQKVTTARRIPLSILNNITRRRKNNL